MLQEAVLVIDSAGVIVHASTQVESVFGHSNSELIGSSIQTLFPNISLEIEESPSSMQLTDLLIRKRKTILNVRAQRKDGTVFPIELWLRRYVCFNGIMVVATIKDPGGRRPLDDFSNFQSTADQVALGIERKVTEGLNAQLANLIKLTDDAIISKDPDGTIIQWNDGAERLYGYSAEEIVGKSIEVLYPEDRLHELEYIHNALLRGMHIANYETVRIRKNGSPVDISLSISPIKDICGNVLGISAIARDMSEQKRKDRLLAEQYAAIAAKTEQLQAVLDALAVVTRGGNWHEASTCLLNNALKQTNSQCGFAGVVTPDQSLHILAFAGADWDPHINREFYDRSLQSLHRHGFIEFRKLGNLFGAVIESRQTVICSDPASDPRSGGCPDGHPVIESFLGIPLIKGTELIGLIALANRPGGYTEAEQKTAELLAQPATVLFELYRKQAIEEQLREQIEEDADKLQKILNASYEAFIGIDSSGEITDWNARAEKVFGWSRHEVVGKKLIDTVVPARYRTDEINLSLTGQRKVTHHGTQISALHRNGHEFPVEVSVFPVTVSRGSLICAFVRDITEEKQAEEAEKQVLVMKEREDFMFTLTHDLKNPLIGANVILDQLSRGEFGVVTTETAEILLKVRDSNSSLISLIQNIIEVYRYEKDAQNLTLSECDLGSILIDCLNNFSLGTGDHAPEVKTSLNCSSAVVLADANSIRRVMHNLVDNAIKFSPRKGLVSASLSVDEDWAVLTVHNHGEWIAPEDREFLFQRFWQGSRGKRYVAGSGLGLYLCHKIVTAHRGTISCASDESAGTTFTVRLPLCKTRDGAW